MPLPSIAKTWQHNVNNAVTALGSALACNRRILRSIKNAMIGFGSNPWTVRGSSDSAAAGMDQVDRWDSDSDLVWNIAGSAHSWIVLRQTGLASNFEICIDLAANSSGGTAMVLAVSFSAGFSGGSTTARPTATDESLPLNGDSWTTISADAASRWSVQQSSDGQCTRLFGFSAGSMTFFWAIEKAKNPITGWSNPVLAIAPAGAASASTFGNLGSTSFSKGRFRHGSSNGNMFLTVEGYTAGSLQGLHTTPNDISGEWPFFPIGLASSTTGMVGRHGELFDMWVGATAIADGTTYPADATKQFVQVGDIILPWNGGAINTS